MMRHRLLPTLLFLFLPLMASAQADGLLHSQGPLPDDLRLTYEQLCETDLKRNAEYRGKRVKDKEAVRQVSYSIGKLLAGGRILFGDPVSAMLSRIADTLLTGYPELRSQLRFYTVKSPEVNAFATAQGMVFVNTGLVAQVDNEAQLAFVLAHEIVHYYRHHSMEMLATRHKKQEHTEDEQADLEYLLRHHARSREMESESDSLGLALFFRLSPYDKQVGDGIFDVLSKHGQSFANVPIDRHLFDGPGFSLGNECWLDSVAAVSSHDRDSDSLSTHPNIFSRRMAYRRMMGGHHGGEQYVVTTRDSFQALQRMARYECLRQELIYADYPRAFYDAYLLLQMDSTDAFASLGMARALYSTAIYRAHGTDAMVGDYRQVEGELQQAYYMLRRIDPQQLTLAAVRKIWQLGRHFPADSTYRHLTSHLLYTLHDQFQQQPSDFQTTTHSQLSTPNSEIDTSGWASLPRLERIKRRREMQASTAARSTNTAFADLLSTDTTFATLLSNMATVPADLRRPMDTAARAQIIYSPTYLVDNDKTGEMKPGKSIRGERRLVNNMRRTGKHFGQGSVDFSDQSISAMDDAAEYNDFVTIHEWMTEFWQDKGKIAAYRMMQPAMDTLLARHNARTVNMAVVVNTENCGNGWISRDDAWAIWNPIYWAYLCLPPVFYPRIFDRQYTSAVTLIVDAADGRILARDQYDARWQDDRALVSSVLHDASRRAAIRSNASSDKEADKRIKRMVPGADGLHFDLSAGVVVTVGNFKLWPMATAECAVGRHSALAFSANYQKRDDGTALYTSLNYRYFFRTDFAPLGRYVGAGLLYSNLDEPAKRRNHAGFCAEIGRNYIFARRLLVNLNFRGNVSFGCLGDSATSFEKSWYLTNLFTLSLSLGFLPF